jgi:hypothetical protein
MEAILREEYWDDAHGARISLYDIMRKQAFACGVTLERWNEDAQFARNWQSQCWYLLAKEVRDGRKVSWRQARSAAAAQIGIEYDTLCRRQERRPT